MTNVPEMETWYHELLRKNGVHPALATNSAWLVATWLS